MRQVTLRLQEDVADGLRREARARGISVNTLASTALAALVDPDLAGTEAERVRARLSAAGILAPPSSAVHRSRPDAEPLARARAAAARGTLLSDLVSLDRG